MTSTHTQPAPRRPIVVSPTPPVASSASAPGPAALDRPAPTPLAAARASLWGRGRVWLWWAAGLAVCLGWDRAAWLAVSRGGKPSWQWLEDASGLSTLWQRLGSISGAATLGEVLASLAYSGVYFFGRIYLWVLLAIVMIFRDWGTPDTHKVKAGVRRGVFVFVCPAIAGLAAELLKIVTRRARPEHADGVYAFVAPKGGVLDAAFWDPSGLGLASSHASVALGGALALGLLAPRLRWWLVGIGGACALSRVLVGAHYLSDVYVGATLGVLVFLTIYAWDRRNNGGVGIDGAPA